MNTPIYSNGGRFPPRNSAYHTPVSVFFHKGKEHKKEHDKSMESFQDCITFHLLDMFHSDAAKQQCYYISKVLKKPQ